MLNAALEWSFGFCTSSSISFTEELILIFLISLTICGRCEFSSSKKEREANSISEKSKITVLTHELSILLTNFLAVALLFKALTSNSFRRLICLSNILIDVDVFGWFLESHTNNGAIPTNLCQINKVIPPIIVNKIACITTNNAKITI